MSNSYKNMRNTIINSGVSNTRVSNMSNTRMSNSKNIIKKINYEQLMEYAKITFIVILSFLGLWKIYDLIQHGMCDNTEEHHDDKHHNDKHHEKHDHEELLGDDSDNDDELEEVQSE